MSSWTSTLRCLPSIGRLVWCLLPELIKEVAKSKTPMEYSLPPTQETALMPFIATFVSFKVCFNVLVDLCSNSTKYCHLVNNNFNNNFIFAARNCILAEGKLGAHMKLDAWHKLGMTLKVCLIYCSFVVIKITQFHISILTCLFCYHYLTQLYTLMLICV